MLLPALTSGTAVFLLDACRTPCDKLIPGTNLMDGAARSVQHLTVFATHPGSAAREPSTPGARNGLFTSAILETIATAGATLDIPHFAGAVHDHVHAKTGGRQRPYVAGTVTSSRCFLTPGEVPSELCAICWEPCPPRAMVTLQCKCKFCRTCLHTVAAVALDHRRPLLCPELGCQSPISCDDIAQTVDPVTLAKLDKRSRKLLGTRPRPPSPTDTCKHLPSIRESRVTQALASLPAGGLGQCDDCLAGKSSCEADTGSDEGVEDSGMWLCLSCGRRLCGRSTKGAHAVDHFAMHPIAMSMHTQQCWCTACDSEVNPQGPSFTAIKDAVAAAIGGGAGSGKGGGADGATTDSPAQCPLPECRHRLVAVVGSAMVRCCNPKCTYAYCTSCKVPWHCGLTCEDYSSASVCRGFVEWARVNKLVQCPVWSGGCGVAVQRIGGCNLFTCKICRLQWCALCHQKAATGWHHYTTEGTHCYNKGMVSPE